MKRSVDLRFVSRTFVCTKEEEEKERGVWKTKTTGRGERTNEQRLLRGFPSLAERLHMPEEETLDSNI